MSRARHKWPTMDAEYRTQDVIKCLASGMGVPYNPRCPMAFRYVPRAKGGIKPCRRDKKLGDRTPLYGMRAFPRAKGGVVWRHDKTRDIIAYYNKRAAFIRNKDGNCAL